MFTGIVEEMGTVMDRSDGPSSTRLVFSAAVVTDRLEVGESVSVSGACLTVVDRGTDWWAADAVGETMRRTKLASTRPGDRVNLERALALGDRLGGHLVQGHVDGVGTVTRAAPDLAVSAPAEVLRYLVEKGSITVDGISLTVVGVSEDGFTVAVIPHTMEVTTIGSAVPGDPVNLEVDVMAKYAEKLLCGGTETPYRRLPSLTGEG